MTALMAGAAGLVGVMIGAFLARRNARRDHADKLLAEALNDFMEAIALVVSGDAVGQPRYASAVSRIALHGSPALVTAFQAFQRDATTRTADGQARLIAAVQVARQELRMPLISDDAASVLLFGSKEHLVLARCYSDGDVYPEPRLHLRGWLSRR